MSILNTPLFASSIQRNIGAGFHNVGSGVLRASNKTIIKQVEAHYGERCGHIPLHAQNARVLVEYHTPDIETQMHYLSQLFGKNVRAVTSDEFLSEAKTFSGNKPLVVPYVNVPETEQRVQNDLHAETWGLPGIMTHILKNKAEFYRLADEFASDDFRTPDYRVSRVEHLTRDALDFLDEIEDIYQQAGLAHTYPLGVMLRAAESDGNYGCCLVYEQDGCIVVVQNGDAEYTTSYASWQEALAVSQQHLIATMNLEKETRIVISRYVDFADSPGMSVVVMDGQVESLRWNGQLQKEGSKACVGTSTYVPKNAHVQRMQQHYEDQTAAFFEAFLRNAAERCGIAFTSISGVANLDIMLPGELETQLQGKRKQRPANYLAECNPRWTNYTDAILTVIGANGKEPTISNMRTVIRAGISTFDKFHLPANVDPRAVRESIFTRDASLKQYGTRIICRMTKNPMGLIFAGDVQQAQQEVNAIIQELSEKTGSIYV